MFLVQEVTHSLPLSCSPLFPLPRVQPLFLHWLPSSISPPAMFLSLSSGSHCQWYSSAHAFEGPMAEWMACPEQQQILPARPLHSCVWCFQFGPTETGQMWVGLQVIISVTL